MPALEVAAQVKLPPGFHCTAFAAEPDVRQPIAMTTDARGRLWVAENYTYADGTLPIETDLRDRIVIFEDSDNDGRFDKRTVFWDGALRLTSIEVGLGGVWALCPPNLLFIPDRNGDDVPDSAPKIVLEGFEFIKARHTVANGLRWGPDGWLYGRQGILGTSLVGQPGAPPDQRISINVGIWRYLPQRGVFEVVAEGTTNPWGMDWNEHGEAFFINTVIGHLWQVIPGAHYRRMFGDDPSPRIYESLEQYADHVHWATSEVWTDVRKGVTDGTLTAGGGHAHTGLLVYQGGQWPAEWNGKLLTVNFHGKRLNVERLEREGSAFVGRREPDQFLFADPWFRGIDLIAAPDGGVFVSDWSDTGECHDIDGIHRTSGRIFKLTYGDSKPRATGDLASLGGVALAKLQLSENDWLARQARRVLVDGAATGANVAEAHTELRHILALETNSVHRLRALWALYVSGGGTPDQLTAGYADRDEYVRAWAIRLTTDDQQRAIDAPTLDAFVHLAKSDSSALVRLALASALQRLPISKRAQLATALLAHAEDAGDHNLPLMLWYGIEPLANAPNFPFENLIAEASIPRVQRLAARRLAEDIDLAPARVNALLIAMAKNRPLESRQAVLDGIAQALSGRRKATKPASWEKVSMDLATGANDAFRNLLRDLSALFGDGRALEEIRAVALNPAADLPQRRGALEVLVESRAPDLRELCAQLLRVRGLSATAATGLALSNDYSIANLLLAEWPNLYGDERSRVMSVLVSRPAWASKALDALKAGTLQRANIGAFQARQIRAYHDPALTKRLEELWGQLPDESEKDRDAARAKWEPRFTPVVLAQADRSNGRAVFKSICAACHTLNGEGGAIGPDLSGAARDNLAYLLENLLFPSAVVPDDYRLTTLTLKDGRGLSGMIRARTSKTLKLQSMTELVALSAADIASEETLPISLMPPGLLDSLSPSDARDLIAYLMIK
ncbi:MAG: c-type cytochrome [Verrucomicrobia bacterium]|nr:c-type cytochrome [Verrucomicrobiota bacterium]